MDIVNLSTLAMVADAPFSQTWGYLQEDESPVDLSDWVGDVVFSRETHTLLAVPVDTDADGNVRLLLDAEQVNLLRGPRVNFQINLTPTGFDTPTEVWRGQVVVQ